MSNFELCNSESGGACADPASIAGDLRAAGFSRKDHPCFDPGARHKFARVHLPVAPKCNIQCNYCNRKNDCVNESRPGVTSVVLSPGQTVPYLKKIIARGVNVAVAGIAGPGDPFANPHETLETLRLVKRNFPKLLLCVASNGLNVFPHADEMARIGVSHATITVNAVDPEISAGIYSWVRQGPHVLRGRQAAEALWSAQRVAIAALVERGITVKINTIIIPGVNDTHVSAVAKEMAALGVSYMNALPMYPTEGTVFEGIAEPSNEVVASVRHKAKEFLPQMAHCTRCRADAAGMLGEELSTECIDALREAAAMPLIPEQNRPFVAVASMEGALVNLHLGQADYLLIFRPTEKGGTFVEARQTPPPGTGAERWAELARCISDCSSLLVSSSGAAPRQILEDSGVRVVVTEGLIAEALEALAAGRTPPSPVRSMSGCGGGCSSGGGGGGGGGGCSGGGGGCG